MAINMQEHINFHKSLAGDIYNQVQKANDKYGLNHEITLRLIDSCELHLKKLEDLGVKLSPKEIRQIAKEVKQSD